MLISYMLVILPVEIIALVTVVCCSNIVYDCSKTVHLYLCNVTTGWFQMHFHELRVKIKSSYMCYLGRAV